MFRKRFPFVRQRDAMECGVACLVSVLKWYGLSADIGDVSEFCPPTTEGVSLLGIKRAAEAYGFDSVTARVRLEQLSDVPLPAIIHWNQNHFVVLYRISRKGKRFYVCDPAKGLTVFSQAEFLRRWISIGDGEHGRGIAMFLSPSDHFRKSDESEKSKNLRSFRFLWQYILRYRHFFTQILLGLLLGCVLQLIMPFLTQAIVDEGIRNSDVGFIWLVLLGELMIVVGKTATDFIRRWILLHISMRINISLVSDFFIKLLRLPMSFFDTKLLGDIMQRMADHGRVQSFLTNQTLGVLFSLLSFIVFGIVLAMYDGVIFIVFAVSSMVYCLWIASFLRRRKVLDYELFEQQSKNQNCTYQFVTSMQEVKLQDCERRRRWEWEDVQADLFEVQMKTLRMQQAQETGAVFINEVKNILITVIAATYVINGELSIGAMLAVQYIVGQLNSPIEQLVGFVYASQDVRISLERINEIHCREEEESGRGVLCEFPSACSIEVRDVSFRYDINSPVQILKNISFSIPAGKVTAIVGHSGSGKTTLIKLLLGYYRLEAGSIDVSGRNLDQYSLRWWRRQCGVVMQDGVIFSESIRRNIAVSDDDVDEERLEQAARIANIHDYIVGLPLRYDTRIGRDGVGLSQGQRQRILIARAVYKKPSFIFLDEATNALDAENEKTIVDNLREFYKGRTVVVVAHRLSTVRNADNIIVLKDGEIVESGTHEELNSLKGAYFNLIKNQLELGT